MIGSLRGAVLERTTTGEVLVEVGGVGYRVAVPAGALVVLEPGQPAFLFTHLLVREDALALYGFPDRDQRDTFEMLMAASGVGPKLALAILSVHSPATLRRAVAEGDLDALTLVPGVGKRTAQRLMIELAAKLVLPVLESGPDGPSHARGEVRAALDGLGYDPAEVREVLLRLPEDGPVELMLRDALKLLALARGPGGVPLHVAPQANGASRA
ncbi:MAG: Holliday junction branch migration protein RuvA [Acidimicrobiia bacterium]